MNNTNLRSCASSTPFNLEARKDTRFNFDTTPAVHTKNNTYISHFFNALSLAAPITEGILMRTVRKTTDMVNDPKLKDDLAAFIAQEAIHTREHRNLNKRLAALGYGVESLIAEMEIAVKNKEAAMSLQELVAFIVTGEHAVYAISKVFLQNPGLMAKQNPEVTRLFKWHALEEMEHQSVCHDIYVHLYGTEKSQGALYRKAYLDAAKIFFSMIANIMKALITVGPVPSKKELLEFCWWFTVHPALLPKAGKELLAFVIPGFTHWSHEKDDIQLISSALQTVLTR